MYKTKAIKNLKIKCKDKIYDKISYFSCSSEGVHFENLDSNAITTNVNCQMEDIEIIVDKDTK